MSENTKRLLSLLLVASMVISLMPMTVSAQEVTEDDQPTSETIVPEPLTPVEDIVPSTTLQASVPALTPDVWQDAVCTEENSYIATFSFTPEQDGVYIFTSAASVDTRGYLYTSQLELLDEDDDDGEGNNFSITYALTANTTYYLKARYYQPATGTFPVRVTASPVASIVFSPISVIENACGGIRHDWNNATQSWDLEYYHYSEDELLSGSAYTVTLKDGTVIEGNGQSFELNGARYSFDYSSEQSYAAQWTVGNTYSITVSALGATATLPVNIIASPLASLSFTPVTLTEGTNGRVWYGWNEETSQFDIPYYHYDSGMIRNMTTYTAVFHDGTVLTGNDSGFTYDGIKYYFEMTDDQSDDVIWTVGNTYYATATVLGISQQIPVTIAPSPLVSLTYTPVTAVENTNGGWDTEWNPNTGEWDWEYFRYNEYDLLQMSTFTATFEDGTVITDNGSYFYYDGEDYNFSYNSLQDYAHRWTVGNTYSITVSVLGKIVEVPVTVVEIPLESLVFDPISVMENTCGYENSMYNPETEEYDLTYYYYAPSNLLENTTFTATFTDGTVITDSGSGFAYNGQWYSFEMYTDQSYNTRWTVDNTYTFDVEVMNTRVNVSVTITPPPLESLTFEPISVREETNGSGHYLFNPETEEWDRYYYYYDPHTLIANTTFTATFTDGTVITDSGSGFAYDGEWYSFNLSTDQDFETAWLVNNTYEIDVEVMSKHFTASVTVTPPPLVSLTFTPVSIIEGTCGSYNSSWNSETNSYDQMYWYGPWGALRESTFTATFTDGTVITDSGEGFEYEGQWYSFSVSDTQDYDNPWLPGNTYSVSVSAMGKEFELPITITESPIANVVVDPVSIMENTYGYTSEYWEDDHLSTYFHNNWSQLVRYTVTFRDGTSTRVEGGGFWHQDQWYYMDCRDNQSFTNQWTAGNTYPGIVMLGGKFYDVPVTILESPVASLVVDPISIVEGKNCNENTYWPGDGQEYSYFTYNWRSKAVFTVTFKDGTSVTGDGTYGFEYNGERFYLDTFDTQSHKIQWLAGNTYTAAASIMGVSTTVDISIVESPVESVTFAPISIEEHKNGYWSWDNGIEYYRYYDWLWAEKTSYTVKFKDGTELSGTYNNPVEYQGETYSLTSYRDSQSAESRWLANNTYTGQIQFESKYYDVYITICKSIEDNGFEYLVQNGQVVITGCTTTPEILQIPETIEGYPVVGVTSLGGALHYARELRIPDSVTMLSGSIFFESYNAPLKKLVIGSGVSYLDAYDFSFVPNLEWIQVSEKNPYLCSVDGVLYDKELSTLLALPAARQDLYVIPDSVTDIDILFNASHQTEGNMNVQFGAGVTDYVMVDGIIYNKDMTVVFRGTPAATGEYVMPETVEDINEFAFNHSQLSAITISPKVTDITYTIFTDCQNLQELTIPESVRNLSIGGCDNLEKLHVSSLEAWCSTSVDNSPLRQGADLYVNGEKILDLVIPDVVEVIYSGVFQGGNFRSVTIPTTVKEIGYYAFEDCYDLEKIYITDLAAWCNIFFMNDEANPLYYGADLYVNGEKIVDLEIPDTVEYIGMYAFVGSNFASVTVPRAVEGIGYRAFAESAIENAYLMEGVRYIEEEAFSESALTSIGLPDSLEYLGYESFYNCKDLAVADLGSGITWIDGKVFYGTGLKEITIPAQVEDIYSSAFKNSALTQVHFECENVRIWDYVFENCPIEGELVFGDNVEQIESEAFNNINATQIKLPDSVTALTYRTFAFNTNLVSITIPDTIEEIWDQVFEGDVNLSHVLYTGTQEQWDALEIHNKELNNATLHCEATGDEVTVEETCTTIELFCQICNQRETIQKKTASHEFVNGVCTVCGHRGDWEYILDNQSGNVIITGYAGTSKNVVIPDKLNGKTVTDFAAKTFSYNDELRSIVVPGTIKTIPAEAFKGCYNLESVVLKEGVTTVGDKAFSNCRYLYELTLADTITEMGARVFEDCHSLSEITIPAGIESIGNETFAYCYGLRELNLPDTVTEIAYFAFADSSISDLVIPASVKDIGAYAFASVALNTVKFLGEPPVSAFFDAGEANVYYPASTKGWDTFVAENAGNGNFIACATPKITEQPVNAIVPAGQTATVAAQGYGVRLSYQWYYAEPGSNRFEAIGGDSIELSMEITQENAGARAYCVVTDILGQTAKTKTVTLKLPSQLTGIRIAQLPYTLEYDLRQEMRTRGLVVVNTYSDGSEVEITDYTVSGYNANVGGNQTITVTSGAYTATFTVKVNEEKLNFVNQQESVELSAPEGAVQDDAELLVEKLEEAPVLPEVPEILEENNSVIFDISLEVGGETVQPTQTVQVSIPVPQDMHGKRCKVYHIGDDGSAQDMGARYKDGRMVFDTNHFSYYAVVEVTGVTVSGTLSGAGDIRGTVINLISNGEVLETIVSQDGTYCFENVVDNDYIIEAVPEGRPAKRFDIQVEDIDILLDILLAVIGDIDGNSEVNSNDVIQLLLHVSLPGMFPIDADADFNHDGNVTSDDIIQLLLHISLPDLFPLGTAG